MRWEPEYRLGPLRPVPESPSEAWALAHSRALIDKWFKDRCVPREFIPAKVIGTWAGEKIG